MLAGRDRTVVARGAGAEDLGMIDGISRYPLDTAVTAVALVRRLWMCWPLAGRISAVVATDAVAGNVDVVEVRGHPCTGRMAVVTGVAARDVRGMLARSQRTVMAGAANTDDLGMIDDVDGNPLHIIVAVLAEIRRRQVRRVLACCGHTVVATRTWLHRIGMVEVRWYPARGRVAVVAVIAARDMLRMFAGRYRSVVAGAAGADYLGVVDRDDRRPDRVGVAILTDAGRVDVRRRLAGRRQAIVTARACVDDIRVIEIHRRPADRRVAVVAAIATLNVLRMLAGRDRAVVAGEADTDDLRMVDGHHRGPCGDGVAVLADVRRLDMIRVFARRVETVVTTVAVAGHADMVEYDRDPRIGGVAVITLLAGRRVARRLAGCNKAVVARTAAAKHRGVVHVGDRAPGRGRMTVAADLGRVDVIDRP